MKRIFPPPLFFSSLLISFNSLIFAMYQNQHLCSCCSVPSHVQLCDAMNCSTPYFPVFHYTSVDVTDLNPTQKSNVIHFCMTISKKMMNLCFNHGEILLQIYKGLTSYTVGGNANQYSHYGEQCGDSLKNWKQNCHMTQQSHSWAYTRRKPELKETRAPQCSLQHCL